jgi:hypothetical protein
MNPQGKEDDSDNNGILKNIVIAFLFLVFLMIFLKVMFF